jgi:hypothetical protein
MRVTDEKGRMLKNKKSSYCVHNYLQYYFILYSIISIILFIDWNIIHGWNKIKVGPPVFRNPKTEGFVSARESLSMSPGQ